MRFQLALNVDDLETAIDYYSRLFGTSVNKRETGYANFVVDNPPLKLVLFEAPGAERLNHVGVEVFDDAEVDAVASHMSEQQLLTEQTQEEVCCYAEQNKAISHDPQGLMWEWYRVLQDSPTFFAEQPAVDHEETAGASAGSGCC